MIITQLRKLVLPPPPPPPPPLIDINMVGARSRSPQLLVKCWALWGERERRGRHNSDKQTVQQPSPHSAFFSTEQSNANKRRLDRECCLSHPVASLGERVPVALSWRLRSLSLGVSVRDPALMKYYDRALKRRRR